MEINNLTFEEAVNKVKQKPNYKSPIAFGFGIRRKSKNKVLDVWYPSINYDSNFKSAALIEYVVNKKIDTSGFYDLNQESLNQLFDLFKPFHNEIEKHTNLKIINQLKTFKEKDTKYATTDVGVYMCFDLQSPVTNGEDAYFRLQLLSQRLIKPHGLSLEGLFGKLENIAWTNQGPVLVDDLTDVRLTALLSGENLTVSHIDKFPYLVNYTVPKGVRIASGSQVRLGAYLGEGTTIMPAGYVNFNAGTEGNAMIEGRVSAGVFVGKDSDVGGGASIMGTLSGGNNHVISIGANCLLGANAGTGISLGFGCTIAAGLYVYSGMKVSLLNKENKPVDLKGNIVSKGDNIIKAIELSGRDFLLFIQNSQTGEVYCKPNPKTIQLNKELHKN